MEEDDEKEGKKKKDVGIAFKASKHIESSSENDDEEVDSDDVEYLSKKFCKIFNNKREAKEASKRKSKLIGYECNKPGHVKLPLFE